MGYQASSKGEWDEHTAGGHHMYADTFVSNPRWSLHIKGGLQGMIRLMISVEADKTNTEPIGVYLLHGSNISKDIEGSMIAKTRLFRVERDAIEVSIPAPDSTDGQTYTIVASLFSPGKMGKFTLNVCADAPTGITLSELKTVKERVVVEHGRWDPMSFNGNHNTIISFDTNPKFLILTKEASNLLRHNVRLFVECPDKGTAFFPYLLTVTNYKKWDKDKMKVLTESDCVLFPPGGTSFYSTHKSFDCELKTGTKYLLVMSTPGICKSEFKITLKSELAMEIVHLT
jgi:hypothetical protein